MTSSSTHSPPKRPRSKGAHSKAAQPQTPSPRSKSTSAKAPQTKPPSHLWSKIQGHRQKLEELQGMIQQERCPSTLIFHGPSGVGKFLVAQATAQHLICATQQACGSCRPCQEVESGLSDSLLTIQPETAQIKVDAARQVVRFMHLKNLGSARVVIVNEAHRLNPQSANILLKTLEEPPENSYLILVTSTLSGLLPTIRSRSHLLHFSPLQPEELKHIVEAPPWALSLGRVDLVNEFLDLDTDTMEQTTSKVWSFLLSGDLSEALKSVKDLTPNREDSQRVAWLWQQMLKAAWIYKLNRKPSPVWKQEVIEPLSQLEESQLSGLTLGAVRLERDLASHIEKILCFENYFYKVEDLLREHKGDLL